MIYNSYIDDHNSLNHHHMRALYDSDIIPSKTLDKLVVKKEKHLIM